MENYTKVLNVVQSALTAYVYEASENIDMDPMRFLHEATADFKRMNEITKDILRYILYRDEDKRLKSIHSRSLISGPTFVYNILNTRYGINTSYLFDPIGDKTKEEIYRMIHPEYDQNDTLERYYSGNLLNTPEDKLNNYTFLQFGGVSIKINTKGITMIPSFIELITRICYRHLQSFRNSHTLDNMTDLLKQFLENVKGLTKDDMEKYSVCVAYNWDYINMLNDEDEMNILYSVFHQIMTAIFRLGAEDMGDLEYILEKCLDCVPKLNNQTCNMHPTETENYDETVLQMYILREGNFPKREEYFTLKVDPNTGIFCIDNQDEMIFNYFKSLATQYSGEKSFANRLEVTDLLAHVIINNEYPVYFKISKDEMHLVTNEIATTPLYLYIQFSLRLLDLFLTELLDDFPLEEVYDIIKNLKFNDFKSISIDMNLEQDSELYQNIINKARGGLEKLLEESADAIIQTLMGELPEDIIPSFDINEFMEYIKKSPINNNRNKTTTDLLDGDKLFEKIFGIEKQDDSKIEKNNDEIPVKRYEDIKTPAKEMKFTTLNENKDNADAKKLKTIDKIIENFLKILDRTVLEKNMYHTVAKAIFNYLKMNDIERSRYKVSDTKWSYDLMKESVFQFVIAFTSETKNQYAVIYEDGKYVLYNIDSLITYQILNGKFMSDIKFPSIHVVSVYGQQGYDISTAFKDKKYESEEIFQLDILNMLACTLEAAAITNRNVMRRVDEKSLITLRNPTFKSLLDAFEKSNIINPENVDCIVDTLTSNSLGIEKVEVEEAEVCMEFPNTNVYQFYNGKCVSCEKKNIESMFEFDSKFEIITPDKILTIPNCSYISSINFKDDLIKILKYVKYTKENTDEKHSKKNHKQGERRN